MVTLLKWNTSILHSKLEICNVGMNCAPILYLRMGFKMLDNTCDIYACKCMPCPASASRGTSWWALSSSSNCCDSSLTAFRQSAGDWCEATLFSARPYIPFQNLEHHFQLISPLLHKVTQQTDFFFTLKIHNVFKTAIKDFGGSFVLVTTSLENVYVVVHNVLFYWQVY